MSSQSLLENLQARYLPTVVCLSRLDKQLLPGACIRDVTLLRKFVVKRPDYM